MIHLKIDETTIYHFHDFFYQNECEKMCSYLVEIDSQDENDFLTTTIINKGTPIYFLRFHEIK